MRYAEARMIASERDEICRVYVTEHLRALVGSEVYYCDMVQGTRQADFDAEQVVDDVVALMGLEEE